MVDGRKIADELAAAERDRRTLLPFTDESPDFDLDTSYDAQWMGIQAKLDTGDRLVGAKAGTDQQGEAACDERRRPAVRVRHQFNVGALRGSGRGLLGCVLRVDGEVEDTATGAAVMGHPAASVAWLANQLAGRGRHLQAGWLIFSGGLTEPIPLRPGLAVTAEFHGLGTIEVHGR
jgi:2-keto-4-pentenoate hydratase